MTKKAMTKKMRSLRLLGKGVLGLVSRAEVTATLSVLSLSLAAAPALAGPEGEQVVRGNVRFERRGNEMWITAGRNSIINYRSFNIAGNETVRFIQPDANSRVLNRVTTAAPTIIDGSLFANGRVYIVNPAGVYFGQNAVVDVNALHAAAGTMTNSDFLGNVDRFTNLRGPVMNQGQIRANAVSLVGQQVGNFGSIVAPQGMVVLAAGQDVIVGERGGNVVVRVPRTGTAGTTSVTNTGEINAKGGGVTMIAGDVLGAAMFNSGRIAAHDVRMEAQGRGGTTTVAGQIDATSTAGAGGTVRVLGEQVSLNNATIDASGTTGGSIMVGGNFRGRGPEARAANTTVDASSTLRADGASGDAGHVVAWSDGTTRFDGVILARARGDVGSGGVAEVSGKEHVSIGGHAYLTGKTGIGEFTIDPGSVNIVDGPNTGPGGALDTFNDAWIIDQMNNGGATLNISTANSTNAGTQDLTVDVAANISYNSSNLLILDGGNSVTVDGTITNAGQGGLALTGGAITVNGAVSIGGSMVTNGTTFTNAGTINAGRDVTLTQTGAVNVNANITAGMAFNSVNTGIGGTFDSSGFAVAANAGDITISHAGDAVTIGDLTGSNAIAVTGANVVQSGTADALSYGITATGSTTINGAVTLTGAQGFTADSASFSNTAGGTIAANHTAGLITISTSAGNITLGGAVTTGTGGITLSSLSSGQILQNAAATTSGGYGALASNQFSLGANVVAGSISIQSGTSGTGNLILGGNTLRADSIFLRAGDGSTGTNAAIVDLSGNPTFANTAGSANPTIFSMRQDAGIADAGIAALARFQGGSIAGMLYTLQSDAGGVTNSTATKLNGSNLHLSGQTGVTLSSDLSLASLDVTGPTTLSADLTTGTGSMQFHSAVALGTADRSITAGQVMFDGAISGTGGGITINNSDELTLGGAVTLTGAGAFNQSGPGAVLLSSGVTTQNQNISFAGPISVTSDLGLSSGTGTITLANAVDLVDRTLTLSGDEIDLTGGAGSIAGSGGSIVLEPSTNTASIGVGGGAGALDLSATDIAALGTGISSITIGRSGGSHAISMNAATFASATTIRAGASGTIAVDGQLTGTGAGSFNLLGTTTLDANIVTVGQAITITGNVVLGTGQTDYALDTTNAGTSTGANITITGTTNSESAGVHGLDLAAGVGDISFGNVGDTARLNFLRILNAHDATLGSVVADFVLQNGGTGLTTIGDITADQAVNLIGNQFSFQNATVNGGFGFLVDNSGTAAFHGNLLLEGQLLQSGTGGASLGGAVTTSNDAVTFNGPITLTANSTLSTGNGSVQFASTLDGAHDLAITTTNGDATFTGAVGATTALGTLTVASRGATFSSTAHAGAIDVTANDDVSIAGDVTATTLALHGGNDGMGNLLFGAPGISLSANSITLAAGDTAPGGTATLNLGTNTPIFRGLTGGSTSPDSLTLIQDAAFTDADLPDAPAFGNGLSGLAYTITSRDGNVVLADATKVNGTALTVNGALGVDIRQSLLLDSFATSSIASLNGDIQTAGDITFGDTLSLTGVSRLNSGLGTTTLSAVVAGDHDFAVTADSLELTGQMTGTGILVLQPGSASRDIRLGGTTNGPGTFEVTQAEIEQLANGWGSIFVGKNDGSGLLTLGGDTAFVDPVTLRMNGVGGRMDISHRLGGADNASLHLLSGGNITLYANIVTSGNQIELAGDVVLGTSALVDSTDNGLSGNGADVSFRGRIDSAPSTSHTLSLTSGQHGSSRLEGEVGFFHHLDTLAVSGSGIQLAKVTTTNSQTYNGIVYAGGDLTSTTGGSLSFSDWIFLTNDTDIISAGGTGNNITIGGGIDSFAAGQEKNVRMNSGFGNLSVGGNSGGSVRVAGFGATGATITTKGVRSTGFVTYTGPAAIGADIEGVTVTFNDDLNLTGNTGIIAASSANFVGAVYSEVGLGNNLVVTSPVTTFSTSVGDLTDRALGRLATSGATTFSGAAVRTSGSTSIGGPVQLNNDVTFAAGPGGLEFLGGINSDSTSTPRSLILNSPGRMDLVGSIGNTNRLASITTTGGGTIHVAAPQIRTIATQDYSSPVIVDGNTAFTGSSITFSGAIDSGTSGAKSVSITANGGSVLLSGAVGGTNPLSQFNVTATSFTLPGVRTTGSQSYTGLTTLTGNLTATTSGAISFSGATQLDADVTVSTAGDNVSFASTVNSKDTSHSLTVNAGQGAVTFGSDVGFGTGTTDRQLSSFSVAGRTVSLNGVQTSGDQFINGTTTFHGNLTSTGAGSINIEGVALLGANLVLTTASGGIFLDASVDSDTTTRSLSLSSGGNSVKRLGGAIGATAQLSTITVNGDGSTILAAPTIKTSGNQTYSGPVTLGTNVAIASPAAVTFVGTVDSDSSRTARSLTVDSTGGAAGSSSVTFSGAVGSTNLLTQLQTAGPGSVRLGGDVTVKNLIDLFGPVKLLASLTINANTGIQIFRSTIDTEASLSPVDLTLRSTRTDLAPDRVPFRFGGSIGATNALANLTIGPDLASPYRAASIVFAKTFDTTGRILASEAAATNSYTIKTNGSFTMGAGQKLTAFGRLNINAGGSATLGDLNSIADITVTSDHIFLRARQPGEVFDNTFESPDVLPLDSNLDFVAPGGFVFSSAPTVIGSGSTPSFASNSGVPTANLENFAFRRYPGHVLTSLFTDTRSGGTNFLLPLDLRAIGSSAAQLATSLAGALPRDATTGEVASPRPITTSMESSLADMGIQTRSLTVDETINLLSGRATYDDVRPRSGLVAEDYRIAANRITAPAARRAIDAFRALTTTPQVDANGKPIVDASGKPVVKDRTADIKASFARAWEAYSTKTTTPSGVGFRAYLENRGAQASTTDVQALKDLIAARESLTSIRAIGLSEFEASIPRRKIIAMIRPDSIPDQTLLDAIFGAPVRN